MLKDHYETILAQLQSDMASLAKQHPELAVNLQRQNTDPDAARLLEGVALLAARQREQMENDREEQSQGWLQAVAPDILKPLPAMVMANITAPSEETFVPMGSSFTVTQENQIVHWRSAVPTTLVPLELLQVSQDATACEFQIRVAGDWVWSQTSLTLQWTSDIDKGQSFFHELIDSCRRVTVSVSGRTFTLDRADVQLKNGVPNGSWLKQIQDRFDQPLLPQWLKESFVHPLRTLAVDIPTPQTDGLALSSGSEVSIRFELDGPVAQTVSADQFTLNALPLINLKESSLLPFSRRENKSLYELSMITPNESTEQIVSLISVEESTQDERFAYEPLHALPTVGHGDGVFQTIEQDVKPFFQIRLDRSGDELGLVKARAWIHQGDDAYDCVAGEEVSGEYGSGTLMEAPTKWQPSLNTQAAQWQVWQTQQRANQSLTSESLKQQLQMLCPSAEVNYEQNRLVSRWIDSVIDVKISDSPITRGTSLVLGQHVQVTLSFVSLPKHDAWWLSTLIWQWLRSRLAINSVMAFSIDNEKGERVLHWPHASGTRAVV